MDGNLKKYLEENGYNSKRGYMFKSNVNSIVVVKPQKSTFADDYYLNFGIVYTKETKNLNDGNSWHLGFRYRQLLKALSSENHPSNNNDVEKLISNLEAFIFPFVSDLDNLNFLKETFPNNFPKIKDEYEEDTYIEAIEIINYSSIENELL